MNTTNILFLLIIIYFIVILIIEVFFTDMNIYTASITLLFLFIVIGVFWFKKKKVRTYRNILDVDSSELDTTPLIKSDMICKKLRKDSNVKLENDENGGKKKKKC